MATGSRSREELLAAFPEALLVIELIGQGVNGVTGDYSRGAAGFMVRGGEIAEPVAEITIASNLIEMFATLEPASDLEFRRGDRCADDPGPRDDGGRGLNRRRVSRSRYLTSGAQNTWVIAFWPSPNSFRKTSGLPARPCGSRAPIRPGCCRSVVTAASAERRVRPGECRNWSRSSPTCNRRRDCR